MQTPRDWEIRLTVRFPCVTARAKELYPAAAHPFPRATFPVIWALFIYLFI